jgi:hypothetical protein
MALVDDVVLGPRLAIGTQATDLKGIPVELVFVGAAPGIGSYWLLEYR